MGNISKAERERRAAASGEAPELSEAEASVTNIETVRMTRSDPMQEGGPVEADVHPNEVGNWQSLGWRRA